MRTAVTRQSALLNCRPVGGHIHSPFSHSQFFFRWHNRALMLHGIRRTFRRKCQIIRKFLLRDVCERFRCHTVAGKLIQERPDERIARSGGIRDRHRQRFGFGARVRRVDCRAAAPRVTSSSLQPRENRSSAASLSVLQPVQNSTSSSDSFTRSAYGRNSRIAA